MTGWILLATLVAGLLAWRGRAAKGMGALISSKVNQWTLLIGTLPLAFAGWLVSVFQVLLVAGWIPEGIRPCSQGVPCSEVQIEWLGFVNIPLLSFLAFSTMNALLVAAHVRSKR